MVQNQLHEVHILPPDHPTMEFPPTDQGSRIQNSQDVITGPGAVGPTPNVNPLVHFII